MPKLSRYLITIKILTGLLSAQAPDTLWTRTFGGDGSDYAFSVQQTADGGYIIAGYTESFGVDSLELYLIKTDATGNPFWARTYGGIGRDYCYWVQQTSDSGYIIAGTTTSSGAGARDLWLLKVSPSGDTVWTKTYGGTNHEEGMCVQQTFDNGYIIAGLTNSFGAGAYDVWLIKTDSLGNGIWTRTYGGTSYDVSRQVQQTSDGGYIIVGFTESFGAGNGDIYLIKTNANGDSLWIKTYGGVNRDFGFSVQQTIDNGYIIAGYTYSFGAGSSDVYLIKTDVNGQVIWTRTYGGALKESGRLVQQTSDGGYIIVGYTESFGMGGSDVWLLKIDENGDSIWTRVYGGSEGDAGYGLDQTTDNGYIITGATHSFGAGGADVWILKTEPDISIDEERSTKIVFFVSRAEPNPFQDQVKIKYGLPKSADVQISIYNLLGQEVRALLNEKKKAGIYYATWDGRSNTGNELPAGIYFVRLKSGAYYEIIKIAKLEYKTAGSASEYHIPSIR